MTIDPTLERAWALFRYATEDFQKARLALEAAQKAMDAKNAELQALLADRTLRKCSSEQLIGLEVLS